MKMAVYVNALSDASALVMDAVKLNEIEAFALRRREEEMGLPQLIGAPDMALVVGGDGTLLQFIHDYPDLDVPIIHVGAGRVNFLSDVYLKDIKNELINIISGNYFIEERRALSADVGGGRSCFALNEVVMRNVNMGRLVTVTVMEDGDELLRGRMDGIIVATPTGSTAYSFAAGGPVLDQRVNAKLIIPLVPFSVGSYKIVHPFDQPIMVASTEKAFILCDGENFGEVAEAVIKPWQRTIKMVRTRRFNLYERMQQRLSMF
ncbi:inorganic polyphosphate/ATP-NAD kinase [Thermocladium modestius]|uniref:NAD kinase n=1 Tax=Thermocladium modestius TaxID=62609 RepID=A0A830H017_9CREN|nr:NAD(+)/NADH kinase [Thermocladium modestius]GGP21908.1 inorganic polyphosphate/ATP-NAD kinase [Thermocladium modestius]